MKPRPLNRVLSPVARLIRRVSQRLATIELESFNSLTENEIQSSSVALEAIQGKRIQAMLGSYVDRKSVIGSYSYLGFNSAVSRSTIGRYTSIAGNVTIGAGEHELNSISTSSIFYADAYNSLTAADCRIGNDVWIGVDAIVRRGVMVGNGAVIGANSFVNTDVPPFAIFVGSPARLLRYRFTPEWIQVISESRWWELELKEAKTVIEDLQRRMDSAGAAKAPPAL
jgi:virginiamycin A acetyltransferase